MKESSKTFGYDIITLRLVSLRRNNLQFLKQLINYAIL